MVGDGLLGAGDLGLELGVLAVLVLELFVLDAVEDEERHDLQQERDEQPDQPELAAFATLGASLLREQVYLDHARDSFSCRSARPAATDS